jgi:hypothetical protein
MVNSLLASYIVGDIRYTAKATISPTSKNTKTESQRCEITRSMRESVTVPKK